MKSRHMRVIACLLILPMLISCATIIGKGGPEALNIRSTPDQATITITDEGGKKIFEGKTPTVVSLEKKKGYFSGGKYTIKISKDGFADHSAALDTTPGGWYLTGNLVFGFVIGWFVVDPLTGAMWTLSTNEVNANLEAGKKADNDLKIVLLKDVPLSLRDKMVKVSQENLYEGMASYQSHPLLFTEGIMKKLVFLFINICFSLCRWSKSLSDCPTMVLSR